MKRILFDIGANRGLYADANVNLYDQCILVEANPELSRFLSEKYNTNPGMVIVNKIVSNKQNETFYISNADTISTVDPEWVNQSRFSQNYSWHPVQGLPTFSIDELVQTYGQPSFLKVDVEGYEYNVILSMTQKYCPLSFEWAEEKKQEILLTLKYLHSLGYSKFSLQMEDSYTYQVKNEEWVEFSTLYSMLETLCDVSRKSMWGMIWAS